MKLKYNDMPKLFSPFVREIVNGNYVCVPKIEEKFRWVFTEESEAVEKLDGTNVSIVVKNGEISSIFNRKNLISMWKKGNKRFIEGVLESIERGYIDIEKLPDGQYYGELIGPKINGNPYKLDKHLWLPFDFLRKHYKFKFWDEFVKELKDLDDNEIFEKVDTLFKGLWSLFKRKRGIKGEVNENVGFEGMSAEGIVFYRKNHDINIVKYGGKTTTFEMAKLRRDMFEWFKGRRHTN